MFQYSRRQNVLIQPEQNLTQGVKCFNTPRTKNVPGGRKMFQYPHFIYYCGGTVN